MIPWPQTSFTERLGISLPLIQAPMAGGITTPELVAAVCKSGGVGSLAAGLMEPDEIRKAIRRIRELTRRPFNVNLFYFSMPHEVFPFDPFLKRMKEFEKEVGFSASLELELPPSFEKQAAILLEEEVPIFSFTFGIPPLALIREFKKKNTIILGTATHPREAVALQEMGIDFIVAQGKEAGGHRGTFLGPVHESLIPTLQLVTQIQEKVKKPLIAAGGIMSGGEILAAIEAGASAVQLGTAFLASQESGAPPIYKRALLEWKSRQTELTRAFTGRWGRAIVNRFIQEIAPFEPDIPPYPIAQSLTRPMRVAALETENPEFMSLWAGEKFSECQELTAQEIIARFTLEMQ